MFYANPDPQKMHAIDVDGMLEMEEAVGVVEERVGELKFLIMHGAYDQIHAGADITQFAGDCDYDAISLHLKRGTDLDVRVKGLWPQLRTVSVMCGDRYGGSVEWPLYSEWSVCDTSTRIQFSEVHLGIIPGWNGVLNVLLKSNKLNAQYMGMTGNGIAGPELIKSGLAQKLVETQAPPDRRSIPREDWPDTWAKHAGVCQKMMIDAALELATCTEIPARDRSYGFCMEDELKAELGRRLNRGPYQELRDYVEKSVANIAMDDRDALKALNKEIFKKLAALGKPLGPESVEAVGTFLERWGDLTPENLLKSYRDCADHEERLCDELMHTMNRRIGINAVLSKNPVERVAVFE